MTLIQSDRASIPIADSDPLPPESELPTRAHSPIEQVYRAQRSRLMRFLGRRSPEAADDVVQQSFVRILSQPYGLLPRITRLDSYLFRIARNLQIDKAKDEQRRSRNEHLSLDLVESTSPEQIPAADQIAALEARDMLRRLEALMQRLGPRTREIFLAHRVDGYTYAEIAARTGLSVKGVEKHMSKAIATIDRTIGNR